MPRNKYPDDKSHNPFASALRKLMTERDIKQEGLAKITGKTRQTISQYTNGISEPGYETLVKIADYFDVSTDYLLGRTEDPGRLPCATDDLMLSKNAIRAIKRYGRLSGKALVGLDLLLQEPSFSVVCLRVTEYKNAVSTMVENPDVPKTVDFVYEQQLTEELISKHPELSNSIWVSSGLNYSTQLRKSAADYFTITLLSISEGKDLALLLQEID